MKFKILVLFTVCNFQMINAQKTGLVYYGYVEALGIGNAKGIDNNAYILFNNEQSYYVTAKDSLEKTLDKSQVKTFSDEKEEKNSIHTGMKISTQGDQVVFNINKNTIWSNLLHRKQIYVKEVGSKINWKVENDSKKIGMFTCKKATAKFRGRDYTAWFTYEIPLPFGPWKLNGLPGMILEAYDQGRNVFWYYKSIDYPSKIQKKVNYLKIPKQLSYQSYGEFKKFQEDQILKTIEKQRIAQKNFPGVVFIDPKLSDSFIECE